VLASSSCLVSAIVGLKFGIEDDRGKIEWYDDDSKTIDSRWVDNFNAGFAIVIFCCFLIVCSGLILVNELAFLVFKTMWARLFRFLKFIEGHAGFYIVLGMLTLGIAGDSGILTGSFTMCVGGLHGFFSLYFRATGAAPSRGDYRLYGRV